MTVTDSLLDHLISTLGFQYDIDRVLGRGGMGTVYHARERALDREVAIKVLLPDTAATPDARERFLREARTAAKLTHPNIVPLFTFGDTGSVVYYVMGFVDGESLEARLRRDGRMCVDDARQILQELAGALAYAHEKGIVHRDLKPDNILIENGTGRALLTDFGIARQVATADDALTQTGVVVGTPRYMSPEQAAGDRDIDGRSDIYSLGVVAYTILAGRPPFDATGFRELLAQQMTRVAVPLRTLVPSVPLQLATTIERCMKKDPVARWTDASRVQEELREEGPDDDNAATRMAKAGGWILTYGMSTLLGFNAVWWMRQLGDIVAARSMLLLLAVSLPVSIAVDCWRMRRSGATPAEIRGLIFMAPKWWPFWWPASLRQPNDVWPRLPLPVRVNRLLRTLGFASFFAGLEATFLLACLPPSPRGSHAHDTFAFVVVALFSTGLLALCASALRQFLWVRHLGLTVAEGDRIAAMSTSRLAFWKRPQVARLLSAPSPGVARRAAPEGAPELLTAIQRLAAELTGPLRELGADSVAAARQLSDLLAQLDREIAALARDADPIERRRLEQRMEAAHTGDSGREQGQMRELYVAQLALLRRLGDRLDDVTARRQRVMELLRVLWLQLSSIRGQLAEVALQNELTGRIRSLIADAARYSEELRDQGQQG